MKKSHPIVLLIRTRNTRAAPPESASADPIILTFRQKLDTPRTSPASVAPQFGQRRKKSRNGMNVIAPSSDPPYALGQSVPPASSVCWYALPLAPYISAASRLKALIKPDLEEKSMKRAAM